MLHLSGLYWLDYLTHVNHTQVLVYHLKHFPNIKKPLLLYQTQIIDFFKSRSGLSLNLEVCPLASHSLPYFVSIPRNNFGICNNSVRKPITVAMPWPEPDEAIRITFKMPRLCCLLSLTINELFLIRGRCR